VVRFYLLFLCFMCRVSRVTSGLGRAKNRCQQVLQLGTDTDPDDRVASFNAAFAVAAGARV
jgi:hypothetical protein